MCSIRKPAWPGACAITVLFLSASAPGQILNETQKLLASDGSSGANFGDSVSISGNVAIVGAPRHYPDGAAYIFRWDGSSWVEEEQLFVPGGQYFGWSVSVSGNVAVIGDPFAVEDGLYGSAYVYRWDGSSWGYEQTLRAADEDDEDDDAFGLSVSVSGNVILVGSPHHDDFFGSAYVFRWNGSSWVQEEKLIASDRLVVDAEFGISVSISGDVALVGAWRDGADVSGSAYIFRRSGSSWEEEQKLLPVGGGGNFGTSVSVDGVVAVVGAVDLAHVFRWNGSVWMREQGLLPVDGVAGSGFGNPVSVSGNVAVVGARGDDDNGMGSGSAYVFRWSGSSWFQAHKLLPSDGTAGDQFGGSFGIPFSGVSVSGNLALVGAPADDDNGASSGSAYVFDLPCPTGHYGPMCLPCPGGAANPCNGNGTCDDGADGTGVCTCESGWTGPDCGTALPLGACCTGSSCTETGGNLCTDGATFVPGGECQGVTACCLPDESCVDLDATCCQAANGIPTPTGLLCADEDLPNCAAPIPTVSAWGFIVLTLLTLTGAKLAFRSRSQN